MFWACFLLFLCWLCYFFFPISVVFTSSVVVSDVVVTLRSGTIEMRLSTSAIYISTDMMIVIFRCLESGKTIMMCMDIFNLSKILECYDIRLNKNKVDRFFAYTRVYFFSPSTGDYNFSVSVIDNMAERFRYITVEYL